MKICLAGHGEALGLEAAEIGQFNIPAGEIGLKNLVEKFVACWTSELRAVMRKQDVVELGLASGEIHVCAKGAKRLAIDGQLAGLYGAAAPQVVERSRYMHISIQITSNWIVETEKRLKI